MKQKLFRSTIDTSSGFTLIEIMISIFVFTMIAYGLISLLSNILTASSVRGGLLSDQDQARKVGFQIIKELRNGQTGMNGAYVLDTAQDQQIIFYSNADTDTPIERIRYYVQKGKLYKGITEFNGSIYNTTTEQSIMVQNNLANASNVPIFYYYDDTYVGSSSQVSLSQPVNVTAVKFIKVNLQVYNKAGVANNTFYTVTASGAIRNLKTNLGN